MHKFKNFYFAEKKNVSYDYSSTQVNMSEELANNVMDFSATLSDEDVYTTDDPSYGREDIVHVTILYGIHDSDPSEVKELLKGVEPFTVTMGEISFFDNDEYRVMKIDVESPELHKLNKLFTSHVAYSSSYPDYMPHATISYMEKGYDGDDLDVDMFNGETSVVDSVVFSPSGGGETTTIKLG